MKTIKGLILIVSVGLLMGCVQKKQEQTADKKEINPTMAKIIDAHGGVDAWQKQHTLAYEMGNQSHTIDLKSREVKITTPAFSMGNDNGTVWLMDEESNFEGSPTFYHSLMFYFHTMPFVFADDGINYQEMPDKEMKGVNYKAIKMSFSEGVGDAPKDEYIVYYHPDSYKMEWLAYTSTYQSQEKSDDFGLIHYKTWEDANGFLLPTELQWYQYEDGQVGEPQGSARTFANTEVMEKDMGDDFYAMPEGATVDSASVN